VNGEPNERRAGVVALVTRREVTERLRSKSFAVLTGLLVVVVLAVGVISRIAGSGGEEKVEVGVTASVPRDFEDAVVQSGELFDREVAVTTVADGTAARAALDAEDIDVAVDGERGEIVFERDVDDEIEAIVQQAWAAARVRDALVDAGLSEAQVASALSPEPLQAVTVDGDSGVTGLAVLTGTLVAVLLFMSLQTFGGYVLSGVVEEKSTAVVELLLARVRADQLLAGKVIGIGFVALVQFAITVVAGLVSLAISGRDVPSDIWAALPLTIAWFLGGYALYSTLFALAGSLVSRQEDAQGAAAPIMTALIGAYLLVFVFGYVPDSTVSRVLSIIPPIAPFLMPMRMAAGAASIVEIALALVLLLAATVGAWKLAAKIYEQVLLHKGSRIAWRDALSLVR
jgi:ABC-2 type transport system permease protein